MDKKIILGSASPRRRELLSQIGIGFTVRVSEKEEVYHSETPEEIVKELALMKAENVASEISEGQQDPTVREEEDFVIIGADTVVVLDQKILGKPADGEDAFRMLKSLQGRAHEVYTGVAVLCCKEGKIQTARSHAVKTAVYVHEMTDEEIHGYIATGEPADKAGAYGIQGTFAKYIDRVDGDYYNVVGLPVSYVYQTLKDIGVL